MMSDTERAVAGWLEEYAAHESNSQYLWIGVSRDFAFTS